MVNNPEDAGSKVDISAHSFLLRCEAEAQLSWWVHLQAESVQSPRRSTAEPKLTLADQVSALGTDTPSREGVSVSLLGVICHSLIKQSFAGAV